MTGIEGFRTKNPHQPSEYVGIKSIYGAQGRTRTGTAFATTPSR